MRRLIYREGGKAVDELTVEAFEIEDKEDLIDEIMNKYGQEVLQLVYSYVNNKRGCGGFNARYICEML